MHEQFVYGQIKIIDKDKPLKFLFENPDLIIEVTVKNIVKERTAELYQLNKQQKAIFNTASIGIILVKDRVILDLNNKAYSIFGYENRELLNKSK